MNPAQLLNPKAFAKASSSTKKASSSQHGNSHSMSSSLDTDPEVDASQDQKDLSTLFPSAIGNMTFNQDLDREESVASQQEQMDLFPDDTVASMPTAERCSRFSSEAPPNDVSDSQEELLTDAGKPRNKSTTTNADVKAVSTPSYNPAALLNPKAAVKRAHDDPTPKDIQINHATNSDADESEVGMGSLIEGLHKVKKRESQPQKRQKVETDEDDKDKPRAKFNGGGKGGVIGEYMKKERDQAEAEAGPSKVVDLTADDDEDVVYVETRGPDPMREVCLGVINADVSAHSVPSATNKALDGMRDMWPPAKISHRRPPGTTIALEMIDKMNNYFGKLDPRTASALIPLMNNTSYHKMRLSFWLEARPRSADDRPGKSISSWFKVKITVFAAAKYGDGIGQHLNKRSIFLYNTNNTENRELINPHVPKDFTTGKPGIMAQVMRQQQQASYSTRTVEEIKSDVQGMFDKLTQAEDLQEMEGDSSYLSTELMEHQKQALWFLTQHETPVAEGEEPKRPLWKRTINKAGSTIWVNVISGTEVKIPEDILGGILADMMGLGKTLSLLSRIVASIQEAREFGDTELPRNLDANSKAERNTKGTLIVCPKSVLSNWDEQIKQHLQRNKITFYTYHGTKREQNIDLLAQYDIVITSYSTVATELSFTGSRFKALGKLNWFRIILDEAHMIRNQTTSTFLACCALSSPRRWAVTGTPVQNKLDDLGALIKFIKISPFHEKGKFEQYFLAPFKMADVQVLDNLRLLVDSITLRRSKDKIDLPDKNEFHHRLNFSHEERALYDAFSKDSNNKLNAMIGANGLRGRGYAHMLTAITRLRLICAHGRELLSDEDMKMLEGMSYGTAISLSDETDDKPVMNEAQVYQMLHLLRESNANNCSYCDAQIGREGDPENADDDSDDGEVDGALGYMTPCYHLICPQCMPKFEQQLIVSSDKYATCPVCQMYIRMSFPPITRAGMEAAAERRDELRTNPEKAKKSGLYSGPHTKVKALLGKLIEHKAESDLMPDEPPIRSVVFSGWTQYLDLIEIALRAADIGFLRLDGKMSVPARTRVLEQFRTDPVISVILVSIKAGGQGLNFTAASKVYMMEPQFNPGVEMQAIDRVHRLGQTRNVTITKYIMADSFEEAIVVLQKKKMQLASEAFKDGKRMTKMEEAKKRMEDLRSLFK